jgi:hypothetical protein
MKFMQTATQTQTPSPDVAPKVATYTLKGAAQAAPALPVPTTRAQVRDVQLRRSQISDQLENVSSRRSDIAEELARTGADVARSGLEQRLQLLDQRILQLETDLAQTGQQLASAPVELVAGTEVPSNSNPDEDFQEGVAAGGFSVFAAMAIILVILRRRWRRRAPRRSGQIDNDATERLQRLENGMDAIAIEIERVSEGQRFVTKLLSESHNAAANAVAVGSSAPLKR